MGWETRNGRGRYYTRTRRRPGGGYIREYLGCGRIADVIARHDAREREERACEREAERAALREHVERWAALDALLDALDAHYTAWLCADLEAAGYHQHKGQWRKKRRG